MFRTFLSSTNTLTKLQLRNTSIPVIPLSAHAMSSFPYLPNTEPPKDMTVFKNIAKVASQSEKFRRVLWTGRSSQLVVMTIPVGGEIGQEIHTVDQHLSFHSGTAKATVNGQTAEVGPGDLVIVPAGAEHNFVNAGPTPLVLSTVYSPAEHKADTVHESLREGEELEEAGKDEPPVWAQDLHKPDKA